MSSLVALKAKCKTRPASLPHDTPSLGVAGCTQMVSVLLRTDTSVHNCILGTYRVASTVALLSILCQYSVLQSIAITQSRPSLAFCQGVWSTEHKAVYALCPCISSHALCTLHCTLYRTLHSTALGISRIGYQPPPRRMAVDGYVNTE